MIVYNGFIKKGDILLFVNGKFFKGFINVEVLIFFKDMFEWVMFVVSWVLGFK